MTATVADDTVVSFHYALYDESGELLERSPEGRPLAILQGHGNVIPGLERALAGHAAGERFEVTVPPEQGYGRRVPNLVERVSKKHLVHAGRLVAGAQAGYRSPEGTRLVTVVKVGAKMVDIDLNHPQAGRTLRFDVEVVDVRPAEPDEIAHGHVHGPGGHAH